MVLRGAEYDKNAAGWGLWYDTKKSEGHGGCDRNTGGHAERGGDFIYGGIK